MVASYVWRAWCNKVRTKQSTILISNSKVTINNTSRREGVWNLIWIVLNRCADVGVAGVVHRASCVQRCNKYLIGERCHCQQAVKCKLQTWGEREMAMAATCRTVGRWKVNTLVTTGLLKAVESSNYHIRPPTCSIIILGGTSKYESTRICKDRLMVCDILANEAS